jgi:hypothetical protein
MRSKLKLLILLLLFVNVAFSQRAKFNPSLYREIIKTQENDRSISLLVQGDVSTVQQKTKELGGRFKYSVNSISSITIPLNKILILGEVNGINKIEGLYGTGALMDDMTLINANVNPVHLGYAPLSQAYDGSGVVMGFLDTGIDFKHPDFINADGSTRVKYLWDQNLDTGGSTPIDYGYGQEWDAVAIDAGLCTHNEAYNYFGHGSNVTGIGAGNGLAINNLKGVAPASDLIVVSVAFDENFLNNVVDGTEYIYSKAAAMGKPAVVNASLGSYFGSHDGTDLAALLIDDLITQSNGRSFVCAAGNAGNNGINPPSHLGYDTHPDSSFSWFYYNSSLAEVFYEWWIDKDDAENFSFAIGADITNPFTYYGRTEYLNLKNDFEYVNGVASKSIALYHDADLLGSITIYSYDFDSTYACDIIIDPELTTYYWRFITNGTGRFDCWSAKALTGTSDIIWASLPSSSIFPDIDRYKAPDYNQTIVSSFTCSDKVITVGNYSNRASYLDFYGTEQIIANDTTGKLAGSSSFGPTRDGRIKPEVAAPGNTTLATGQLSTLYGLIIAQPYKVAQGGMHNRNGGTSMASPVVAGIASLLLQKNPQASWREIKDAIITTTYTDSFTGNNLPDNKWGYGKANAFAAMITTIVYGCTNPYSINFSPLANVDDGSCVPIVFGCNDVDALNYNPDANMNDGSCIFEVGISELNRSDNFFSCYPNPSSEKRNEDEQLIITDIGGKTVAQFLVSKTENHFTFNHKLSSGLYFCRLIDSNQNTKPIKLLVY